MTDYEASECLEQKIRSVVGDLKADGIGIAFSGGVDSSLLAKLCADAGKNVTLLTVSFNNDADIKVASEINKSLGLSLRTEIVSLDELDDGLRTVLGTIEFGRMVRFENCVCFYFVFRLASRHGLRTVVSANGLDELFCGYSVYKMRYGNEDSVKSLMRELVKVAHEDKVEMDKLASPFRIKYICPFMTKEFVDYAMRVPLDQKIKGADDDLRKHILREVALNIGVPSQATFKPKKAFQYSSGVYKAIRKLARMRGFTRTKARAAGFRSETEAYIKSLKETS